MKKHFLAISLVSSLAFVAHAQAQSAAADAETQKSLQAMLGLINKMSSKSQKAWVLELKRMKLQPVVVVDKNPDTGSLTFIRLNRELPGIRYFHAQFFDDQRAQHVSFEFQPSVSAFQDVEREVGRVLGRPHAFASGFSKWRFKGRQQIWVKRLNIEDLDHENPFNAYTNADAGTVRVVLETDVHAE